MPLFKGTDRGLMEALLRNLLVVEPYKSQQRAFQVFPALLKWWGRMTCAKRLLNRSAMPLVLGFLGLGQAVLRCPDSGTSCRIDAARSRPLCAHQKTIGGFLAVVG